MTVVPYITLYDGETIPYALGFAEHRGATAGYRLSYGDPRQEDWLFGVLWHRQEVTRAGRPAWQCVNTLRQRRCMLRLLCQVCGRPARDRSTRRISWLLADPPGQVGGVQFTHTPPTCRTCIPLALRLCPRLDASAKVCTVARSEPYGVVGEIYSPASDGVVVVKPSLEIPLDAYRDLEWTLASQLIVSLAGLEYVAPRRKA
ncbi:hypothetical protein ACIBKY_51960 [Nonomuraea sp. NPDC050394]|uniref:hypothetical protein n=1 Tax=Nonomuraea sp. NPDC050394 TaxID=3364363 RepID=UPI0037BD24D1